MAEQHKDHHDSHHEQGGMAHRQVDHGELHGVENDIDRGNSSRHVVEEASDDDSHHDVGYTHVEEADHDDYSSHL